MNSKAVLQNIKELLYQCEFKRALEAIGVQKSQLCGEELFTLLLFEAQALFECHRASEAKELLASLTASTKNETESYLFVAGRLAYVDRRYEEAETYFKSLAEKSESVKDYHRALLGLANTYYTLERFEDVRPLLVEIEELSDVVEQDARLSALLLRATIQFLADGLVSASEKDFCQVITEASRKRWNYFIIKSLYGLAVMYKKQNNRDLLQAHLRLLKCYLDPREAIFLTFLVNDRFKEDDFTLGSSMTFDSEFKRIRLQGDWIALHDKPLLYQFLELLHERRGFVTKREIAGQLWPEQDYDGKSHDARIFDIARRVRAMIEPYDSQPVSLLSGRFGYKLVQGETQNPQMAPQVSKRVYTVRALNEGEAKQIEHKT